MSLASHDPPASDLNGQWREATGAEMDTTAGHGVVLLNAKDGKDWIVSRINSKLSRVDEINIARVTMRSIHEYGTRQK